MCANLWNACKLCIIVTRLNYGYNDNSPPTLLGYYTHSSGMRLPLPPRRISHALICGWLLIQLKMRRSSSSCVSVNYTELFVYKMRLGRWRERKTPGKYISLAEELNYSAREYTRTPPPPARFNCVELGGEFFFYQSTTPPISHASSLSSRFFCGKWQQPYALAHKNCVCALITNRN